MKEKPEKTIKKTETIQEFLARGGAITKLPPAEEVKKKELVKQNTQGPANLLTYAEADLYYGESKPRKPKKDAAPLDMSALPEVLRKKHLSEVEDGEEESLDEDEEE